MSAGELAKLTCPWCCLPVELDDPAHAPVELDNGQRWHHHHLTRERGLLEARVMVTAAINRRRARAGLAEKPITTP